MLRSILLYVLAIGIGLGWLALFDSHPYIAISLLAAGVIIWLILRVTRTARLDYKLSQAEILGMQAGFIGQRRYMGLKCPHCYTLLRSRDDYNEQAFKEGVLQCGKCGQEIDLDLNTIKNS
jgi:hypothetical protein